MSRERCPPESTSGSTGSSRKRLQTSARSRAAAVGVALRFGDEDLELRLTAHARSRAAGRPTRCANASRCAAANSHTAPHDEDGWQFVASHAPRTARSARVTVRVVIADDQQLIRTGFRMILAAEPDIEVVGEAATGTEAVALHPRAATPTSC